MSNQEIERLVAELDAIEAGNQEDAHETADSIVLRALPDVVREAYERVVERCGGFWYA